MVSVGSKYVCWISCDLIGDAQAFSFFVVRTLVRLINSGVIKGNAWSCVEAVNHFNALTPNLCEVVCVTGWSQVKLILLTKAPAMKIVIWRDAMRKRISRAYSAYPLDLLLRATPSYWFDCMPVLIDAVHAWFHSGRVQWAQDDNERSRQLTEEVEVLQLGEDIETSCALVDQSLMALLKALHDLEVPWP